jgi:hypothetical protein
VEAELAGGGGVDVPVVPLAAFAVSAGGVDAPAVWAFAVSVGVDVPVVAAEFTLAFEGR